MITDKASLWADARRFEDILRKNPRAYSFAPLADIYRELGLLDEALAMARKGCEMHPGFAAGQMALARAALECSLKDEAKRSLEAVVSITPENLEAQRLLADIYTADGDEGAAQRCRDVANSLEPGEMPAAAEDMADDVLIEEEILDADILELTDDLIEEESFDEPAASPFSADPERPSLGDAVRAEPYLMETPPPLYDAVPSEQAESSSMASVTIAELYVSQGFPEKGAEIYRKLLIDDPANPEYIRRRGELLNQAPAVAEKEELQEEPVVAVSGGAEGSQGVMDTLNAWLENIRGVKECRTKIL